VKDELDIWNCVLEWALIWTTDKTTWSPVINELVEKGAVDVSPYDLELDYDYWSYGMAN
jgi:tRNA (guanine37-N1)-methyltransferase